MHPWVFALTVFLACTAIGTIAIMAGTGGGVLFTTLFLGFTSIHPDIVRATGLLAAMCGTRIGARRFLRKGMANIKLVLFLGFCYTTFAVIGALVGLEMTKEMGDLGIALIKMMLGIIVICVGILYLVVKGVNYPAVEKQDRFTEMLGLSMAYYEESRNSIIDYRVRRAHLGIGFICIVGLISGTFGLGAGWAITPVLNLVMMAPLKVAVASSAVMISMGDTAAIFPYLLSGSIFPLFAVPAVSGLIAGAEIGSRMAVKVRAGFIRLVLIIIMMGTGLQLVHKGLELLGVI